MVAERVEKVARISKSLKPDQDLLARQLQKAVPPDKEYFESLMRRDTQQTKVAGQEKAGMDKPTPIEEIGGLNRKAKRLTSRPSSTELVAQTQEVIKKIDQAKEVLQNPSLKVKHSVQSLLRNRLTHIDESLKIALSKAGLEYTPPEADKGMIKPIERFLGYLTHSQHQLENLSSEIQQLHLAGKEFTPANMLALQIKVSYLNQQIEFFTSALNKMLESTKTLLNVQV